MAIVDSHCHASKAWFLPVESLVHEMDQHGVAHAVLIQIRGQLDNSYQAECVRRFPGRFANVVGVDWEQAGAVAQLERLAGEGASGLRLRPDSRSPGDDPLAIWRAAERLGLAVSVIGTPALFGSAEFAQLVQAVPRLPIVVEHLAGIHGAGGAGRGATAAAEVERVLGLAAYRNVYVKLPGLGEFCERAMPVKEPFPFVQPIPPLLEQFCDAFGAQRLMWGSDFPPVAGREGYGNALRLPMEVLASRPAAEREAIFGGTALGVFAVRG